LNTPKCNKRFNFTPQLIKTSINHKTREKHVMQNWKSLVAVPKNQKQKDEAPVGERATVSEEARWWKREAIL